MAQESSVTGPCEWCLTFSGRTKKGRACCELRALAMMPKAQRQDVYMRTLKEDGIEAEKALKAAVGAEYRRYTEFKDQARKGHLAAAKAALSRPCP